METKAAARPDPKALADVVAKLTGDYGDRAVTARAVREHHSHGEGLADAALPDVVVFPRSNEEVASIVRLCALARVPVIAFGVGTYAILGKNHIAFQQLRQFLGDRGQRVFRIGTALGPSQV